jgi:predicted AlkP superfamily phosphohydrolase/phosphomutase
MFYRYTDPEPRAPRPGDAVRYARVVEELYVRMDALLGRVRAQLGSNDLLIVLSDHGFASFRRGVDLNAWLHQQGYLALKEGATGASEYLRDVDWSRTRAYAVGLAGLYLNLRGREAHGVVAPGAAAEALKREIGAKLARLRDADGDRAVVREVVDVAQRYSGPYRDEAPDLIVGYADGYRVSWEAAVGKVTATVISDNVKSWSGDHCVDPSLVPGVLFCSRRLRAEAPSIVDVAPSVLELYGIRPPAYMEGRSLGIARTAA